MEGGGITVIRSLRFLPGSVSCLMIGCRRASTASQPSQNFKEAGLAEEAM